MSDTIAPTHTIDPSFHQTDVQVLHEGEGLALKETLLGELPLIEIGNVDPLNPDSTNFPDVLYHGAKGEFALDDSFDHRTSPVQLSARTGKGLYCGSREVAGGFGDKESHPVEILPSQAVMLDLSSPEADQPLSETFRTAFGRLQAEKLAVIAEQPLEKAILERLQATGDRFVTRAGVVEYNHAGIELIAQGAELSNKEKQEVRRRVEHVISRANTHALSEDPETSLSTLFGLEFDKPKDGPYIEIAETIDFLVGELGVDGARTKQTFGDKDLVPELREGFVFWKLDKIGTKETWEKRRQTIGAMGSLALLEQDSEKLATDKLSGNKFLSREDAEPVVAKLKSRESLIDTKSIDAIVTEFGKDEVDPYDVMKALAETSPEIATLLAATTGVVEGYRLHEHTQAVLGQFEKHFAGKLSAGNRTVLRTALLLQDIGKSLAVARNGNNQDQTRYNVKVGTNILDAVSEEVLSNSQKLTVQALIGHDIIGSMLQGKTSEEEAKTATKGLENKLPDSHKQNLKSYMQIMYACDASAYTADAGFVDASTGEAKKAINSPALSKLFDFSQGHLKMTEPAKSKVLRLF